MKRILAWFLALSASLWLGIAPLQAQDARVDQDRVNVKSRVYVLDASGSMTRLDYNRRTKSRMSKAKDLLKEELRQLHELGDRTPAFIYAFGSNTSWESVRKQYGSTRNYPINGPLCRDVTLEDGFSALSPQVYRRVVEKIDRINPGGMTPISVALKIALQKIEELGGGEIVFISDFQDPNCLGPREDVCSDLEQILTRIRARHIDVDLVSYSVPTSNLQRQLQGCIPVKDIGISPNEEVPRQNRLQDPRV
jgi:hypothetical protein